MNKTGKNRPSYGTIVLHHREYLELTVVEYAVICRCSPVDVVNAEHGHGRLPMLSEQRLKAYGLKASALRQCETGAGTGLRKTRPGDPWLDIPFENHRSCKRLIEEHGAMTLEEVGAHMKTAAKPEGITRERVRQIEDKARRKRRWLHLEDLWKEAMNQNHGGHALTRSMGLV